MTIQRSPQEFAKRFRDDQRRKVLAMFDQSDLLQLVRRHLTVLPPREFASGETLRAWIVRNWNDELGDQIADRVRQRIGS